MPTTKTHSMFTNARYVASLLFVAMLWLPSISAAYTVKQTATGNYVRWAKHGVTLRIDPALEQLLDAGQARSAATMASDAWRGFAGVPDVMIEQGAPPAYDAARRGNGIYLLAKWPFDSKQLAVTLVTFEQSGEVLGVDVLVNGEKSFGMFSEGEGSLYSERYDLAAVLTHELGHVLGLDESYEHPEATMFPQIHAGETRPRLLANDDQQGVIDIYRAPMPSTKTGCSVTAPRGAQGGQTLAALVVALSAIVVARGKKRQVRNAA